MTPAVTELVETAIVKPASFRTTGFGKLRLLWLVILNNSERNCRVIRGFSQSLPQRIQIPEVTERGSARSFNEFLQKLSLEGGEVCVPFSRQRSIQPSAPSWARSAREVWSMMSAVALRTSRKTR